MESEERGEARAGRGADKRNGDGWEGGVAECVGRVGRGGDELWVGNEGERRAGRSEDQVDQALRHMYYK